MSTSGSFKGWDKDVKLLKYLYQNDHLTPFEMCGAQFEIQCPIFVAREWMRHRTQSFNEMSGRYTQLPQLCYVPDKSRLEAGGQSSSNKQSSGVLLNDLIVTKTQAAISHNYNRCYREYEEMLKDGVSREIARMVLPVNQYTRFRAQANLRNWLQFLKLRLDPSAQWEIQQYAQIIQNDLTILFPRTMELFNAS